MKNTAICGNISSETIRREEHPAFAGDNSSPQRLTRSDLRFEVNDEYDYYIIGYTIADGCIGWYPNRSDYHVTWSSKDLDILKKIRYRFGNYGNIYKQKKYHDHHNQVYTYRLNGKTIAGDFMSLGILPRKTYYPQVPVLPDRKSKMAFIAGLIDGDGCWYIRINKNQVPSLYQSIRSYSKQFLGNIQEMLKNELNLIGSIHTDTSGCNLLYATRASLIIYNELPLELCCERKQSIVANYVTSRGGWENLARKCKSCGKLFIKYRHNQMFCEEHWKSTNTKI